LLGVEAAHGGEDKSSRSDVDPAQLALARVDCRSWSMLFDARRSSPANTATTPPLPKRRSGSTSGDASSMDHCFRRQRPIGPYFADFFCVAAKLVVEIDGTSHAGRERRDRLRDTFLRKRGIRVLRVTNEDALLRSASVLQQIRALLQANSPLAERGGPGG
jgi:hypothetical protein